MVINKLYSKTMLLLLVSILSTTASAIFQQTDDDLSVLSDALNKIFEDEETSIGEFTPMLVATPIHIWKESENDFQDKVKAMLTQTFKGQGLLINCPDCDTYRLHVKQKGSLQINNGPLSLNDLRIIRKIPKYQNAKTVAFVKETKSGVVLEITRIDDGVILFYNLADSTKDLDDVKPWFNYQREYERRKREESLSFVRMNLGLYPNPSWGFEFLEQWGDRNQHISGAGLSFLGPTFALGLTYHFLSPSIKKLDLGVGLYMPLQNLANTDQSAGEAITTLAGQVNATYLFSSTIGVYSVAYFGQENGFSIGLSFYNPVWFPFLL